MRALTTNYRFGRPGMVLETSGFMLLTTQK